MEHPAGGGAHLAGGTPHPDTTRRPQVHRAVGAPDRPRPGRPRTTFRCTPRRPAAVVPVGCPRPLARIARRPPAPRAAVVGAGPGEEGPPITRHSSPRGPTSTPRWATSTKRWTTSLPG